MSDTEPQPAAAAENAGLRCDTCGRPSAIVSRVFVDEGYDRSNARPLWNCPECYEEKLARRQTTDDRQGEGLQATGDGQVKGIRTGSP